MNAALISDLQRLADERGLACAGEGEHVRLDVQQSGLVISIAVARTKLELIIKVAHPTSGRHIEDRLDYTGFDGMPADELAEDMRADVLLFAERLLSRELRISDAENAVQWQVGDRWLQAVPFVPDADRAQRASHAKWQDDRLPAEPFSTGIKTIKH